MISRPNLTHHVRLVAVTGLLVALAIVVGCARPPLPAPAKEPTKVTAMFPIVHQVEKTEDFTGRTEAFRYVEIRPQVTGMLEKVHFKDGDNVRKGDLLFEIDDRLYVAQLNNAKASVAKAKADLELAYSNLDRTQTAYSKNANAKADLDAAIAARDGANASLGLANAAVERAELNVTWTKIYATYSGRMSMRLKDPGNIVTENVTPLSTLIVQDPIYIGFDIDEQSLLRLRQAHSNGEMPSAREQKLEVEVGFGHKDGYQYKAVVTFSDNQLDGGTGTLHIRAEMANPILKPAHSALVGAAGAYDAEQRALRLLSPQMFLRVRMPLGAPYKALLIPEEAIVSDQAHKYIYVLNDKDVAEYRRVRLGPTFKYKPDDPSKTRLFRAVNERKPETPKEGIASNERVVVGGHQRIREKDVVNPSLLPSVNLDE
jgi:RND family efflux transporter MFP subunit